MGYLLTLFEESSTKRNIKLAISEIKFGSKQNLTKHPLN